MTAAEPRVAIFTTKTSLAYEIERDFFNTMFAYVAREADPPSPPQDPSSSPEKIYALFCRIFRTQEQDLSDLERHIVISHIQRLDEVALRAYRSGKIDEVRLKTIQIRLSKASHQDMKPLMLHAEIAAARLKPGDDKTAQGFPDNWERVVDDLRLDEIRILRTGCD
jgi:hypothetical protein